MLLPAHSKKFFFVFVPLLICLLVVMFFPFTEKEKLTNSKAGADVKQHYSTYSDRSFFDQAFDFAPSSSSQPKQEVKGLLFNHHLLAPHFIAQAFLAAQNQKPRTLVILSPNHFSVGTGQILTSRYAWQTPYGELRPDLEVIKAITETGLVKVDEPPFENELGIANVVAFARRAFPDALVVPLIVKDNLSDHLADSLAETLRRVLPENSLVAGSFDFSHDVNLEIANQRDEKSLAAIEGLDFRGTSNLEVDSHPGLRVLLEFLSLAKADSFTLLQHSNSAIVTKNLNTPSTTSYITGYFY